jgi:hypothetical protein
MNLVAHIVTDEAEALGDPEVIVMTAEETGETPQEIARCVLPDGTTAEELLADNGWRVLGDRQTTDYAGYWIVDVEHIDEEHWTR